MISWEPGLYLAQSNNTVIYISYFLFSDVKFYDNGMAFFKCSNLKTEYGFHHLNFFILAKYEMIEKCHRKKCIQIFTTFCSVSIVEFEQVNVSWQVGSKLVVLRYSTE